MEEYEEEDCELKWGKQKKNTHKKEGGFKYKMNKRTISLKWENKKQDKHEERRSYTKN
jgi:hypothetical protein